MQKASVNAVRDVVLSAYETVSTAGYSVAQGEYPVGYVLQGISQEAAGKKKEY